MFAAFFRFLRNLFFPPPAETWGGPRTLSDDGIAWEIRPEPSRVIAIGDVHGYVWALSSILLVRGPIDEEGRRTGSGAHLVLIGDLVRGHRDSRLVMDLLIRLETESRGAVHALLGNHDLILARDEKPLSGAEKKRFEKNSFRGDGPYAKWLRERN